MSFIQKHKVSIGILVVSTLIFWCSVAVMNSNTSIFPNSKSDNSYYHFNDAESGGNSTAKLLIDSASYIQLNYTLKKGYEYPYAGISIVKENEQEYFSSVNFDQLNITISASQGTNIPISLVVDDANYNFKNNKNTLITFQHLLNTSPTKTTYTIPFSEFTIPEWWYKEHNIKEAIVFNPTTQLIKGINIENCNLLEANESDVVKIYALNFSRNSTLPYIFLLAGSLIAAFFFIKTTLNNNSGKTIVFEYSSSSNEANKEVSVVEFIGKNYPNPELNINSIKKSLCISEAKITEEIKEKTELGFKQYLNLIRLNEAKELLKNSEMSISEIAYQVGYNNVSHFNRVFKNSENTSPGDFRKNSIH